MTAKLDENMDHIEKWVLKVLQMIAHNITAFGVEMLELK